MTIFYVAGLHQVVNQFGMHNLNMYGNQLNKGLIKAFNLQNDNAEKGLREAWSGKSSSFLKDKENQNFFNKMTEYLNKEKK